MHRVETAAKGAIMAVILLLASMKFLDLIIIRYWLCRLWLDALVVV
jgi:hypothetical protein